MIKMEIICNAFNIVLLSVLQVYVRAHFSYDPTKDKLIPCADAGLAFEKGEVLQIVDQEDPNWWQV